MLDPPPVDALAAALEQALAAGLLSDQTPLTNSRQEAVGHGYGLTAFGELASRFSDLSMQEARLVLSGYFWNVSTSDIATVLALCRVAGRGLQSLLPRRQTSRPTPTAPGLRAGLPPYLVSRNVMGGARRSGPEQDALPPAETEAFYYRTRLLLADDLLEGLLMFEGFRKAVERLGPNLVALDEWCERHSLALPAMLQIVRHRDSVLEDLLRAGLNPFWGGTVRLVLAAADEFVPTVIRLKRCFYEAFRLNLLTYDAKASVYRTRHGLRVRVPAPFGDLATRRLRGLGVVHFERPLHLVAPQVSIRPVRAGRGRPAPLLWQLEAPLVSVLDGYVEPDPCFLTARTAG